MTVKLSPEEMRQEILQLRLRNAELIIALQVLELTVRADPRHGTELPPYYRHAVNQAQAAIAKTQKGH